MNTPICGWRLFTLAVSLLFALPSLAGWDGVRTRTVVGVGGVPINVIEAGDPDRPSIIFIHGLSQSHLSWKLQFESSLAQDYHLVAFDLRGHGNSGKPWRLEDYVSPAIWAGDLERVRQATGSGKPLLVAWSYGTWVAIDYLAAQGTGSVAGLVMVGALGGVAPTTANGRPGDAERGMRIREGTTSGLLSDNFAAGTGIMDFFLRVQVEDESWLRDNAAANALLPPYARRLISQRSFEHAAELPLITMPALLVVGSGDPQLIPDDAQALAARLPDAEVSVFEGSGHLLFAEEPDRFNALIGDFAERTLEQE